MGFRRVPLSERCFARRVVRGQEWVGWLCGDKVFESVRLSELGRSRIGKSDFFFSFRSRAHTFPVVVFYRTASGRH